MDKLITEYNILSSEYNTLHEFIIYSTYDKYLKRIEELKKQIPKEYFNKSNEQVKSDFKNIVNNLLKNNDYNIVFRSFYFTFLLDIYIMTQNDTNKKDLNKLTKEEQLQFIDRTIEYLLSFYQYNNIKIQYYDTVKLTFSKLKINHNPLIMINRDKILCNNIKSFLLCCKNFYEIKQQFIRNYTNYYKDMKFYNIIDYTPYNGDDGGYCDFTVDYKDMLISYYTKYINFKENIEDLVIAYITGDDLLHKCNEEMNFYFEDSIINVIYVFYIFEIPTFDQYFINTKFYNIDKYNIDKYTYPFKNFYTADIKKDAIDNIFNYYLKK